jgi:hypothetical protein
MVAARKSIDDSFDLYLYSRQGCQAEEGEVSSLLNQTLAAECVVAFEGQVLHLPLSKSDDV